MDNKGRRKQEFKPNGKQDTTTYGEQVTLAERKWLNLEKTVLTIILIIDYYALKETL
jgi:hypothetical protein